MVPGINTTKEGAYIENLVSIAHDLNGYDVAVINYRGFAGAELETPMVSHFYSYKDVFEAMTFIYENYAKVQKK